MDQARRRAAEEELALAEPRVDRRRKEVPAEKRDAVLDRYAAGECGPAIAP